MAGKPARDSKQLKHRPSVALLTGGSDKPYALGLASALAARGIAIDFVGSDDLNCPEVLAIPGLRFLNFRGAQREDVPLRQKITRVLLYYARLLSYAAGAEAPILHILWNNKFELFDRTVLMAYYRALGKRVVLTAHNVNVAARNRHDSWLNRLSLRMQYRLCHHLFVHTDAMKQQLVAGFAVPADRVTVIPFGVNDTIPKTGLTRAGARQQLAIGNNERVLLFFGQIAPYKGLAYLIEAIATLARAGQRVHLIIAGRVKRGSEDYWSNAQRLISELGISELVTKSIRFIPDEQVEPYFKAADAVAISYVDIFQSGVPFLAFSFGMPVIATDVGSLREDVTSETGVLCRPMDAADLARAVSAFFGSELYRDSTNAAARIRRVAQERHSWETVSERTTAVYANLTADAGRAAPGASNSRHQQQAPSKCPE
jgi:glycosyltransferase involved in cell wall biosynthesis